MTDLSPAAQAVFWAFNSEFDWIEDGVPGPQFKAIAATLRAVVGHDVYKANLRDEMEVMFSEGWNSLRKEILAIATELENTND